MSSGLHHLQRSTVAVVAVTTLTGLSLYGVSAGGATSGASTASNARHASVASSHSSHERMGNYDARTGSLRSQLRDVRTVVSKRGTTLRSYAESLGSQGVVAVDPATGTVRNVGRLNGYLSGPSRASAGTVALAYVRAHQATLGLDRADLRTLHLSRQWTDLSGIRHVYWTQVVDGIPVFGNGLRANVARDGRLLSIQGSPVHGLAAMSRSAAKVPHVSPERARSLAASDVGGTPSGVSRATLSKSGGVTWANHDYAKPVWFLAGNGLRLAWSTYTQAGGNTLDYQHVIDARTGAVLYRHDLVANDRGDGLVFENYPGAPVGGQQHVVNLIRRGFLPKQAKILRGPTTVAWADINDDNLMNRNERVPVPGKKRSAQYRLQPFQNASGLCSPSFLCTWNPNKARSWQTNLRADAVQGFYFDSLYHNYLAKYPFGFTRAAGNFTGNDPVELNGLDGANIANGFPDGNHVDNANMSTPPDGISPRMQMYLFHFPGATDAQDPFVPASSSFDPSVILHEYTHGLSNRLVVDAQGNSTLNSIQSGSMGEAWSDYYAEDYLVSKRLERDTAQPGDLLLGKYLQAGVDTQILRTMPIDCPVGTSSTRCSNLFGGTGGYTYGDFSNVIGVAEVHASGEIWGQTLWDLRNRLGHNVTDVLVTRAMSLSPDDPSFLDMRNSILQVDLATYGGRHQAAIWQVFAHRGMGFFAAALDSGDAFPVEDFHTPPPPGTPTATLSGRVTDKDTGKPVANALVIIAGHDSGFAGDYTDVTDANGNYAIPNVLVGTYPEVVAFGTGYEVLSKSVTVTAGGTTADFAPRRDWASSAGGGAITDFNGPDFTDFGCGPGGAIDLSQGTGWGSTTGNDNGDPTNVFVPKHITVKLPATVTVTALAINPSNTCGDAGSASTGLYKVEGSSNGTTWTTIDSGDFTGKPRALNQIDVPDTANLQYVKFTMLGNQVPNFATNCPSGNFSGCQFTDMTEREVFGTQP